MTVAGSSAIGNATESIQKGQVAGTYRLTFLPFLFDSFVRFAFRLNSVKTGAP